MNDVDYKNEVKKYGDNGWKSNIAILCTKVDHLQKGQDSLNEKLDKIIPVVPANKTRSKMNTSLIVIILGFLIGLAFKVF